MQLSLLLALFGSSPRSWGTRDPLLLEGFACRFIPTVVGNTFWALPLMDWMAVHPHGRGEHFSPRAGSGSVGGSSPRSWGTPVKRRDNRYMQRFIPTVVGNTKRWREKGKPFAVHPHGRGEHLGSAVEIIASTGSSPRSWGTQLHRSSPRTHTRFIPTVVGNTFRVRI